MRYIAKYYKASPWSWEVCMIAVNQNPRSLKYALICLLQPFLYGEDDQKNIIKTALQNTQFFSLYQAERFIMPKCGYDLSFGTDLLELDNNLEDPVLSKPEEQYVPDPNIKSKKTYKKALFYYQLICNRIFSNPKFKSQNVPNHVLNFLNLDDVNSLERVRKPLKSEELEKLFSGSEQQTPSVVVTAINETTKTKQGPQISL